jgi:hypothetical protein
MNKLSAEVHGILDNVTVLLLFVSPAIFQFHKIGSVFTYVLATVHLLLTLSTDFRAGVFKFIPLRIHGLIEITVSIALVGVASWFRISGDTAESYFYLIFSVLLFIVWIVSDYKKATKSHYEE